MGKKKFRMFLIASLYFLIITILISQGVSAAAEKGQEEGALFYGVGTSIKMREFNSSDLWSTNRTVFNASGPINWTRVRAHPFRYEYAVLFTNSSGAVFLGFLNENNKSILTNVSVLSTWSAGTGFRFADLEYERVSGNLIIVYSNGSSSPKYRIRYNGNKSLSSEMNISVARTSGIIEWVGLVQHPVTNEIALAYSDAADDLNALKWNGSVWTSEPSSVLETNLTTADYKGFGIAYEQKSGDILLMWGRAAVADLYYSISLNGSTTWSAAAARTQFAEIGDFVDLGSDPTSDYICIQEKDHSANDIHNGIWNGTGFLAVGNNDASTYSISAPAITLDCAWLGNSKMAVGLYSDVVAGNTVVDWASYSTSANTWTVQTDWTPTPAIGSDVNIRGFSFPNSSLNKSIFIIGDANSDLWAKTVSYSSSFSWANTEGGSALETSLSSRNAKCWDFAFSNKKANLPPVMNFSNITSSEDKFYYNATLLGWCNSTDGNMDNVTYYYKWFMNDSVNKTGVSPGNYSSGTLANVNNITSGLSIGQNWTFECTAYDGIVNSSALNSTEITIININSPPNITSIFVDDGTFSPAGEIDLSAGDIRIVLCNGTADDPDGFSDISVVSAVFYASGNGTLPGDPLNNSTLYKNSSCTLSTGYSTTKKDFNCSFSLLYYAQNGTWTCNATVNDTKSENASKNITSVVNVLVAINVSSQTINYGNIAPGGQSSSSVVYIISNLGNSRLDLSLNGTDLSCTIGLISVSSEHYNLSLDQSYVQMASLSSSAVLAPYFDLNKSSGALSERSTYWRIAVPSAGVKGKCTGIVLFTAQQG